MIASLPAATLARLVVRSEDPIPERRRDPEVRVGAAMMQGVGCPAPLQPARRQMVDGGVMLEVMERRIHEVPTEEPAQ
jgi:hypothetical protein